MKALNTDTPIPLCHNIDLYTEIAYGIVLLSYIVKLMRSPDLLRILGSGLLGGMRGKSRKFLKLTDKNKQREYFIQTSLFCQKSS